MKTKHKGLLDRLFNCFFLMILIILLPGSLVHAAEDTSYSYIFETNEYLFGSQLSEDEQYFYLELLKQLALPTEDSFRISIDDIDTSVMNKSIINAIGALYQDFPEYQWLLLGGKNATTFETTYVNGKATKLTFHPVISSEYRSVDAIKTEQENVKNAVAELLNNMPEEYNTRYERLKYIHDYLVTTIAYDTTQSKAGIRSAAGAMIRRVSVCEGYAKAFKMVCEAMGVPCQIVTSSSHMWNYVQMEDGKWYLVDVTFDDPIINGTSNYKDGKNLSYEYFLKGTDSLKEDKEHIPSGSIIIGGKSFTYETLSTADYDKDTAQKETLTIDKETYSERFIKNLTKPIFGTTKKTIYTGKTYKQSIARLSDAASISYSSNDMSVATVTKTGKIKAVGAGTATITTKVVQGGKAYTHKLKITVKEPYLVFGKSTEELAIGKTFQFTAKRYGISDQVVWSVNDTSIAVIYKGGTLKPKKTGTVIVTAAAGGKNIQITVEITK